MKRDYLNGTPYTMIQKEGMYHFSSDTELLGRFLTVRHKDTVLDIGCSSGALLLYAAVHKPASLCGIDLFDEVLDTARENLEINGVEAELYKTRVQDFSGRQFSLIICNPPYFNTEDPSLISANPFIAASRHEEYLRPGELFESAARLLSDSGKFMMVHRVSRIPELFETAAEYGMRCVRMKTAYRSEGRCAVSAAMEFRKTKTGGLIIEPPAYMDRRETFDERGRKL